MNKTKMLQWIGTHHVGISSRTMWSALLGVDFNKLNPCNYIRDFAKFEVTENALGLVKGLVRNGICIERRILFAMDYCFGWAAAMGIDLWFYIEEKMKYNESRPALHNRRY